jgi:hypothetical protein
MKVAGDEKLALASGEPMFTPVLWHFGQCRFLQEL